MGRGDDEWGGVTTNGVTNGELSSDPCTPQEYPPRPLPCIQPTGSVSAAQLSPSRIPLGRPPAARRVGSTAGLSLAPRCSPNQPTHQPTNQRRTEKKQNPSPSSAVITPTFALNPEENSIHSSVPFNRINASSNRRWCTLYPPTTGEDRHVPNSNAASATARRTDGCVDSPK